jgi:ferredoxin, 2Fe-2S
MERRQVTEQELFLTIVDTEGAVHKVPALPGWRVMEIIRDNGLPILAECGGSCACATCHVYVDPAWTGKLSVPSDDEQFMLDSVTHYDPKASRLSCQILMTKELDGMTVTLAPESKP